MNLKQSALVACLALGLGCGQPKYDQQVTQVPITPTGSIVGRVTDLTTGAPLEGVTVTVVGPTVVTATTNDKGLYAVNDLVVSSNMTISFEKMGFVRTLDSTSIPSYAGNAPLNGGFNTVDMQLAHADGEVRGNVALPNGAPAVGATVVLDQRRAGSYDSVLTTTTDMSGAFKFTGVASSPSGIYHNIYAQYFDVNGDGKADLGTTNDWVPVFPGVAARLFLQYSDVGQRIVASNILDQDLGTTEEISVNFALPAVPLTHYGNGTDQFRLYDQNVGVYLDLTTTWKSDTEVTLKPGGPLVEGATYTLYIAIETAGGGGFNQSLGFQVRGASVLGPANPVANLNVQSNLTNPNSFNYNTNQFVLSWDSVPGLYTYWVYAKDTQLNQTFARITTVNTTPGANQGRIVRQLSLPFNSNRPLSGGNKVTFAVVPVDRYGNAGSLMAAPTKVVQDNIAPSASSSSAVGALSALDAINDTAVDSAVQLRLTYNEPMDPSVAPQFISTAGTIPQTFVWDENPTSGVLTLKIASGADLSGSFVIRGGKDLAGNAISGPDINGYLGGRQEMLKNAGFEDASGACGLTGWAQAQTGGMPATVAVAGTAANSHSRCAAVLGAPTGGPTATGTTKLSQDVTLKNLSMNLGWYFEATYSARPEYYSPSGMSASVTQKCAITDTSDVVIKTIFTYTSATQPTFDGPITVQFTPTTQGQTVRLTCTVDNSTGSPPAVNSALYLDDMSVALVKPTVLNL